MFTPTLHRQQAASLGLWVLLAVVVAAGVATLPLALLARLAVFGVAIALPLINPVFGVYMVVLSVPIQDVARLPGGLSYTQAAVVWATCAWLVHTLAHPGRRLVYNRMLWGWLVLLWALLLASVVAPYSQGNALKETGRWLVAFLVWFVAVQTVQQRWQVLGLLACLLAAPASEAALGLVQFARGIGPESFRIAANLPYVRAYGTIGTPNPFAGYLNMGWPLALALALGATWAWLRRSGRAAGRRWLRWRELAVVTTCWIITALMIAALVASFSRGGWLGAVIGGAGMALAFGRRMAQVVLIGSIILALALILGGAGLLPAALSARIGSVLGSFALFDPGTIAVTPQNFAVVERMAQMWAGVKMFLAHPLTGVGPGNFTLAYPDVTAPPWYVSRGHAHNYYINIAAEAGITGVIAYIGWLGAAAYQAYTKTRASHDRFWRSIGVGCCGVIAAVAGHNLFENLHVLNMGIQFAAVFALVAVMPEKHHGRKRLTMTNG